MSIFAHKIKEIMTEQTTAPAGSVPVELTIIDLQNIRSVIDVAAKRGAFHAAEMEAVGNVFNKLNTFLNAVAPSVTSPETAPQPE